MQPTAPQRSNSRPWDERVGRDASLVNGNKGKRQLSETRSKYASNLPLPPKDSPFLVDMPKRRYLATTSAYYTYQGKKEDDTKDTPSLSTSSDARISDSTDLHMWRSYRSAANGDSSRVEGKKMIHSSVKPAHEVQNELRKGLRDRLRMQEIRELALKEEHMRAREELTQRHSERGKLEDSIWRQRADEKGFEGLKRSTLQQPLPTLPPIDDKAVDELRASLNPQMLHRKGGKRMIADAHPSQVDQGPLFGGRGVTYGDALRQRWIDKSLV